MASSFDRPSSGGLLPASIAEYLAPLLDQLDGAGSLGAQLRSVLGGAQAADGPIDPARLRAKPSQLLLFFPPLAAMDEAGVATPEALRSIGDTTDDATLSRVCAYLATRVAGGKDLDDAMAEMPDVFSDAMVSAVRTGRIASKLADACNDVAMMLEQELSLIRRITKAAYYPVGALVLALGVTAGILKWLTPRLSMYYDKVPPDVLPASTKLIVAASNVYVPHTLLINTCALAAGTLAWMWVTSVRGRRVCFDLLLRVPLVRKVALQLTITRFLRHLARLLRAGSTEATAVLTAMDVVPFPALHPAFERMSDRMGQGWALSDAMREAGCFPASVLVFVRAGEKAATVDTMLRRAADLEAKRADASLDSAVELAPTVLTVLVSALIGALVTALYGGIFAIARAHF